MMSKEHKTAFLTLCRNWRADGLTTEQFGEAVDRLRAEELGRARMVVWSLLTVLDPEGERTEADLRAEVSALRDREARIMELIPIPSWCSDVNVHAPPDAVQHAKVAADQIRSMGRRLEASHG